jgi:predicted CoA-binding protein
LVADTDIVVEQILARYDVITVVGASADPAKAAHRVPAAMRRHGWRRVPVNLRGGRLLGELAYRTLAVKNRCLSIEQRRLGLDAPSAPINPEADE